MIVVNIARDFFHATLYNHINETLYSIFVDELRYKYCIPGTLFLSGVGAAADTLAALLVVQINASK